MTLDSNCCSRDFLIGRLLCLYTGSPLTEEAEIHLPENVIEGSARTSVSVLGKPHHFISILIQPNKIWQVKALLKRQITKTTENKRDVMFK